MNHKDDKTTAAGKLLYEQKMHNVRKFLIVFYFFSSISLLLGFGELKSGLSSGRIIWIILGSLLISTIFTVTPIMAYYWLYTKIQVFEKGIVVPSGLIKNIANYKKYGTRGMFYTYEDVHEIKKVGKNRLIFKYIDFTNRVYIWTKKQRDDLVTEILKAQKQYLSKLGTDRANEDVKDT